MFVHILAWWVSAEDRRSIKRTLSCLTTMVHRFFNKNQSYWLWLLLGLNGYESPHRRYQSAFERDILLVVSVQWVIFFCAASPFTSLIFFSPSEMTRVVYSYVYFYFEGVAVLQTLYSNTPPSSTMFTGFVPPGAVVAFVFSFFFMALPKAHRSCRMKFYENEHTLTLRLLHWTHETVRVCPFFSYEAGSLNCWELVGIAR